MHFDTEPAPSSSVTATTAVDLLPARLAWVPPIVHAGSTVPISLILPGTAADADVSVRLMTDAATTVIASYAEATGHWNTVLDVPLQAAGAQLQFTVLRGDGTVATQTSAPLSLAVASDGEFIDLSPAVVSPEPVLTLPWGAGIGEVGYDTGGDEGAPTQPTSLTIDPLTGDLVVLDTVNRRVVEMTGSDVSRVSDLPGTALVMDVVVNGDHRTATVVGFDFGSPTTTAYLVDLDTGTVETLGPVEIPRNTPINAPFVWNPSDNTVYAAINNSYYPYLDVDNHQLVAGTPPTTWLQTSVSDDGSVTIGSGASRVTVAFGLSPGGLSDVQVDGDGIIWFLNSTIDSSASPESAVRNYLVRLDPFSGSASAVEIPASGFNLVTKRLAIAGDKAFVMRYTIDGLQVDSYTFSKSD